MQSGIPFVIVRNQKKGYGSGKVIEGTLNPGESVVIVEDILTTGGQIVEAAKTLQAAREGHEASRRNRSARRRGESIRAAGYDYESLFTTKDLGLKPD